MNFDLLDMEREYIDVMNMLISGQVAIKDWETAFCNWEMMEIKENLVLGQTHFLLDVQNWLRLRKSFGGGPEIQFNHNDFKPFKIKTILVESEMHRKNTYLCSATLPISTFRATITRQMNLNEEGFSVRTIYAARDITTG